MAKEKQYKPRELSEVRNCVSKGLKEMSDGDLICSKLTYSDNAEGYRWELYRGEVPFWVDLMRFNGILDLLVTYTIMFIIPDEWKMERKLELYKYLLTINDFSYSWDNKFFIKDDTVILCAIRAGEEITPDSTRFLADSFSSFAGKLSLKIYEEFEDIKKILVKHDNPGEQSP